MGVEKGDSQSGDEEFIEAKELEVPELVTKTEEKPKTTETAEQFDQKMKEISLKKQHFVLVHGFSHGAWCWYKIKTLIENSGYKVTCVDLKGSGLDQTDPNTIFTLDEYNKPLLEFLTSLPDDEQVILVGHSAGGINITDATYKFPNKISLVVYVAATMLRLGMATEQDFKDGVPDLSEFGDFSKVYDITFGLGQDQPPTSMVIKKELLHKINYQMCSEEDSTLAAMLVRPGPVRALTSARFDESSSSSEEEEQKDDAGKVPRIYVKTRYDRVVKPEQQEAMIRRWPPEDVYVLESDHSPFFSAPSMLFDLLVKAAASL